MNPKQQIDTLAAHIEEVDAAIGKVTAAATSHNLVTAPSLASGLAALFRERRESLAAVVVAHENARHAARRGGAA